MKYRLTPFNAFTGVVALIFVLYFIYIKIEPSGPPDTLGYLLGLILLPSAVLLFCIDFTIQFVMQFIKATKILLWVRVIESLIIAIGIVILVCSKP